MNMLPPKEMPTDYPLFEIGDNVRIDDLEALQARCKISETCGDYPGLPGFEAGFVRGMEQYCGRIFTITSLIKFKDDVRRWYILGETGIYAWSPDMFDLHYNSGIPKLEFEITDEEFAQIL